MAGRTTRRRITRVIGADQADDTAAGATASECADLLATEEPLGIRIGGQPVSHVAIDAGVTRDVWTAIAPNIETPQLKRIVTLGNRTLPYAHPGEGMVAIAALAAAYMKSPPQAQFHLIASPLVMWIWIGGLIVVGGALIAIWPGGGWAPYPVRRRVSARSRARAERGLARA